MFTQEQKAKKITQAQAALDDARARHQRYADLAKKAEADAATAQQTLDWVKQMPVNGSAPAPATDEADSA